MSKKEIAVFSIIVALVTGTLTGLLVWDYQKDEKHFNEKCERIALLANKEYLVDNFNCYILNGNRIEKVEL